MKLANMVEKISGSVTEGYQKIEDGVVSSALRRRFCSCRRN